MQRRGFTLFEILVALFVAGAVTAFTIFGIGQVADGAQRQNALVKAKLIDSARSLYGSNVSDESEWTPLDTPGRVSLLVTKGYLIGPATTYTSLSGGYALGLDGSIRSITSVFKGSVQISP